MGAYRVEWPCCGDVSITDAYIPTECPFCKESSVAPSLSAEPVAFGMPNTAITGKKMALMMVRLDIPSDDQYGGRLWVPLYAAPQPPSVSREALNKAYIKVCDERPFDPSWDCYVNALRELGIEVTP